MSTPNHPSRNETRFLEIPIVQFLIFIIVTIIYFFGIYHFFGIDIENLKALEPNALGDFLAGTFAPLGFILLILGYMVNTRALKMQAEELKNSVDEQRELVKTAKDELDFLATQHAQNRTDLTQQLREQALKDELNSLPIIQFKFTGIASSFEMINIGSPVINVKIIKISGIGFHTSFVPVLKTSSTANDLKIDIDANINNNFSFKILFTTKMGIEYEQTFKNQQLPHDANRKAILPESRPFKVDVVDC